MHEEQKQLRQLKAAIRLRSLQCEKAELYLSHTQRLLLEAERRMQDESARYHRILAQHQLLVKRGTGLNPALQEQRLLALVGARAEVVKEQQAHATAKTNVQEAKRLLVKARVDADVIEKARHRVDAAIQHHQLAQELTDTFDAQQRQGASYGL